MQTLEKRQTCAVCKLPFTVLTSLGRLECREHAALFLAKSPDGGYYWPCCMTKSHVGNPHDFYSREMNQPNRGCVAADHKESLHPYCLRQHCDFSSSVYEDGAPNIRVNKAILPKLKVANGQWRECGDGKNVVVYMYDLEWQSKINTDKKTSHVVPKNKGLATKT